LSAVACAVASATGLPVLSFRGDLMNRKMGVRIRLAGLIAEFSTEH